MAVTYNDDTQKIVRQYERGSGLMYQSVLALETRLRLLEEGTIKSEWGEGREVNFIKDKIAQWDRQAI